MNMKNRVALYLRLSDEDCDKLNDIELSESIKNQEIMLKKYAMEQGWIVVGVYNDEDYSGSDRDRPNFNIMIEECEKGNVDIVLVKTQARFARDIEIIDKYIHNKFKEWNIRFVTLLEKIDNTKRETKKTSQIIAMTDEWYLEDTSLNIRETFKSKREHGQFTGSFVPYGYLRDPENKNHLIPDVITMGVITRIYSEYANGYSLQKIAKGLSEDNILSPFEYKLMNGCKLKLPIVNRCSNYEFINRSGTYVIKVSYFNSTNQIIRGLTTIELITNNNMSNFGMFLRKVKNDKVKIYYSMKSFKELNIEINNDKLIYNNLDLENKNNWINISLNDKIPSNASCIATYVEILDRTNEIFYEFEFLLKENRKQNNYYYMVYPFSYNLDINLDYKVQIRNKYNWSIQTIKKILRDEVYIGNMVQFKTTTVSYKNHSIIYNDKEKWIRVEDTHEPIIDKDVWNIVQKRLNQKTKSCKSGKVHLLANKVYCDNCERVFCKCGKNNEDGMSYLCCRDKVTRWSNCDNKKYIKEKELQLYVLDKFNNLLKRFYSVEKQIEISNSVIKKANFKNKIVSLNKEKTNIENELNNKNLYFKSLYEDRKNGFLNDDEYIILKENYKTEYNKLKQRLDSISKELSIILVKQNDLRDNKNLFNNYLQIDKLTIEIVNNFIEKIFIGCYDEKTKKRKIHIVWNFIN